MKISSMGRIDDYKPALAMIGLQFGFAGVNLFTRTALLQGMSSLVFVFYRQIIATLFMVSIAFFSRRGKLFGRSSLGLKCFGLMFLSAFLRITGGQNFYNLGLYLSSSTIASAMTNLVPALTFVMAAIFGLEKIRMKSLASVAKILGTIICVSGAISISLLKGPKLLNTEMLPPTPKYLFSLGGENLFLGCLFLFGSSLLWSAWTLLLVPINASSPDYLSSSSWMSFFAALQSGVVAFVVERKPEAWSLNSSVEGIVSAVSFYVQAWCIAKRGPLYVAMYQPLATVLISFFAVIFLNEETYAGSLVGAIAVIIGLYVVLWGKAKDLEDMKQETDSNNQTRDVQVLTEESSEKDCRIDLEKPLLSERSNKL